MNETTYVRYNTSTRLTAVSLVLGLSALVSARAANTNLTFHGSVTAGIGFDSNVYLQDKEPDRTLVPQAVSPFQESFVVSTTPKVGLDYKPSPGFNAHVAYAPQVVFYTDEPTENHVTHLATVDLKGTVKGVPWECLNSLKYIQGSDKGLYFGAATDGQLDGAPAIGGIPIRDRRAQLLYRGKLDATWTLNKWFLRPVVGGYVQDFMTDQSMATGYENYIDRRELGVGADVGYEVLAQTRVYVGYRFGEEIQGVTAMSPYHYDAVYNRPLFGIEGQPFTWLKAHFSIGPDIHHTTSETAPGFSPDYTTLWANGLVTLLPTAHDTILLTWTQNTQPAFASSSVYDDVIYAIAARHQFDEHWSAGAGFKAYNGDWFPPVERNDWIYTPSARIGYKHNEHWHAELTYSYDWTESKVPNTDGRNFTRNLVWLSVRYQF